MRSGRQGKGDRRDKSIHMRRFLRLSPDAPAEVELLKPHEAGKPHPDWYVTSPVIGRL